MKIIFSRKGLDSSIQGGRGFSPIVDGQPISIPIPARYRSSETTYGDLGFGKLVAQATKGRLSGTGFCHDDPMFEDRRCALGQTGASQSHLANQGVGTGDVFLFFGLFADAGGTDKHHRIFGCLKVEEVIAAGPRPVPDARLNCFSRPYPHISGRWKPNNTIYLGSGTTALDDSDELRLSVPGRRRGCWRVPPWLRHAGLSYHPRADSWNSDGTLNSASRGQEFVSHISDIPEAAHWLDRILAAISANGVAKS
ncbi:MAG: hypothetical protein F4X40_02680 [Chloroflexi bacterium]|nr:hypothetical protein [Chloroflexota bacterium]